MSDYPDCVPASWLKRTLGDTLSVLTDYTANGSFESLKQNVTYYSEPNYAVLVRTTDLGKPDFIPERYTDERGYLFQRKTALYGGEIVLANVGSVGKVYLVPEYNMPMTLAPNTYLVKCNDSVDQKFVYQFLISNFYVKGLFRIINSTTLSAINKDNFRSIPIALPSTKSEQVEIRKILEKADEVIQKTEALIEKYQQIKAGLMHDLFTRGIGADGQLRPPREQAPELYQQTPIGWIPKEWEKATVEEKGGLVTSGSRDWAKYYSDDGDIFVRIGNLTREHINFRLEKIQHVTPPENSDGQRTRLIRGDILVSITADLGIVGVIPDDFGDAYINQHISLIRFASNEVNPRYVGNFLSSKPFQQYVERLNDPGAKAGLNLPAVRGFPLVMAPKDEQDLIAGQLDNADNKVQIEKILLQKLKFQKSGLMHDLLTGKVSVSVEQSEEAHV